MLINVKFSCLLVAVHIYRLIATIVFFLLLLLLAGLLAFAFPPGRPPGFPNDPPLHTLTRDCWSIGPSWMEPQVCMGKECPAYKNEGGVKEIFPFLLLLLLLGVEERNGPPATGYILCITE